MNVGSLFSGIGGMDHGLHRAGFRHAFFCESDPWRRSVLAHHWPGVPIYEDVRDCPHTQLNGRRGHLERAGSDASSGGLNIEHGSRSGWSVDLLCGGFPCQDLSVAGQRRGLAGNRSGLFFEFARIIDAVRPRWVLVENVPGLLSSNGGRDFGIVVGTLADLGYGVAWRVLDSRFFGVPQRRRRVFILGAESVGDPRAAAERASQVLAVGTRCPRHPATRGEKGPDVAVASLSGLGSGGPDDNDGQGGRLVASALGKGTDSDATDTLLVANTLKSQAGRGWSHDAEATYVFATLKAQRGKGGGGPNPEETLIAAPLSHGSNPGSNAAGRRREDDFNLVAGPLGGGNDGAGWRTEDDPNLVYPLAHRGRGGESELEVGEPGIYNALRAGDGGSSRLNQVMIGTGVRRLTPRECERLQAMPDDWTAHGPDSRRYAALGDAVTSTVAEWIGRRLMVAA